jgi:hypothetical protein
MKQTSIDLLTAVAPAGLVLLVGTLVGKSYELLTIRQVVVGVVLTFCIFAIQNALLVNVQSTRQHDEFDAVLHRLRVLTPAPAISWLLSDAELAEAETHALGRHIWIVSPDLHNVTDKQVIRNAMMRNMEKGITYTYIVPHTADVGGVLPRLRSLFQQHQRQLRLVRLPADEFDTLAITHIAVFNPDMDNDSPSEVFFELPVEDAAGHTFRGYWVRVAAHSRRGIIGRFRAIAEGPIVETAA